MRKIAIMLILAGMLVSFGCTTGQSYKLEGYNFSSICSVAVVDVVGCVGSEAAKNQIADFFNMELLKKGYSPIERSQVQSILKEQKFQMSEITTSNGIAKAGKILNVPAIMVINVPKFGEDISITAKMIDVETGSILWVGNGSGTTGKTLSTIVGAAAGAVAGASVSGKDDQVLGGVAGGVIGGAAGNLLSPDEAAKCQEIIVKISENLPYRCM